ncbi:hypothetical protein C8R46DRAFT_1040970 [Mycena filopes]|nr:hypothetical protein C8R46DRAFT_1040970 [Mycena filopes]
MQILFLLTTSVIACALSCPPMRADVETRGGQSGFSFIVDGTQDTVGGLRQGENWDCNHMGEYAGLSFLVVADADSYCTLYNQERCSAGRTWDLGPGDRARGVKAASYRCGLSERVSGVRLCSEAEFTGDCREFTSQGDDCVNIPRDFVSRGSSLEVFTRPYDLDPFCYVFTTIDCGGEEALEVGKHKRYPRLVDYGLQGKVRQKLWNLRSHYRVKVVNGTIW